MPAFMADSIDPYYIYNLSLSQLLRGENAKFVWTSTAFRHTRWRKEPTRPSRAKTSLPASNGEAWSVNRQPHMHSNSRYADLVRIALLLEEGQTLHLMAGTPRGWLADGQKSR